MNVGSIGEYIRQQREQAKISLRQLASAAGISNPYLSQIERGLRRPSAEILQQIAKGLRISAEALYVQAGILEDRQPDSGVRAAVLADPELAERQKQVLLEIYDSFRRQGGAVASEAVTSEAVASAVAATGGAATGGAATGGAGTADGTTGGTDTADGNATVPGAEAEAAATQAAWQAAAESVPGAGTQPGRDGNDGTGPGTSGQ